MSHSCRCCDYCVYTRITAHHQGPTTRPRGCGSFFQLQRWYEQSHACVQEHLGHKGARQVRGTHTCSLTGPCQVVVQRGCGSWHSHQHILCSRDSDPKILIASELNLGQVVALKYAFNLNSLMTSELDNLFICSSSIW